MYTIFVVELMCLNLAVIVSFLIQNGIFRNLLSFGLLFTWGDILYGCFWCHLHVCLYFIR